MRGLGEMLLINVGGWRGILINTKLFCVGLRTALWEFQGCKSWGLVQLVQMFQTCYSAMFSWSGVGIHAGHCVVVGVICSYPICIQ